MTSRVTQCPKCQTSFRVTDAQLDIANGAVRCGSCLHIFNATDHWLGDSPAPAKPEPTAEPDNTEETFSFDESELLEGDDAAIFDELFGDDGLFEENDDTITTSNEPPSEDLNSEPEFELDLGADTQHQAEPESTPSSTIEEDDSELLIDDDSPLIDDDEDDNDLRFQDTGQHAIVSEGYADDGELRLDPSPQTGELELSDSFLNLDEWEDTPNSGFSEHEHQSEEAASEEAWAEQLLAEDEAEAEEPTAAEEPLFEEYDDLLSELDDAPPPETELDPALLDILSEPQEKEYQPVAEEEFVLGDEPMVAGERIGENKHELLASIEPEPVEIAAEQISSRWQGIGWAAAIIIGLLLLPLQFVYFNFDSLARDPGVRPAISSICQLTGCKVPDLHDINRIRSTNLMVRSHPKARNALVVDAIITNRADFKQPFPIMELRFTDLNNEVVAGRYFNPDEYLSGELAGLSIMPSQQPVHIALEIVDPGQQAINYQLLFHKQMPR